MTTEVVTRARKTIITITIIIIVIIIITDTLKHAETS
jgi:hypothetical protein